MSAARIPEILGPVPGGRRRARRDAARLEAQGRFFAPVAEISGRDLFAMFLVGLAVIVVEAVGAAVQEGKK